VSSLSVNKNKVKNTPPNSGKFTGILNKQKLNYKYIYGI
jgi:hypothetical protein